MIIAKFRCLEVTSKWNGESRILLRPVTQKVGHAPENKKFWDATPSGECELTCGGEHPFTPGDYYYIRMERFEGGPWSLTSSAKFASGGEIKLSTSAYGEHIRYGHVSMGLSFSSAVDLFGDPSPGWRVEFEFAEPSDESGDY